MFGEDFKVEVNKFVWKGGLFKKFKNKVLKEKNV